jgi:hypothetical protein
MTHKVWILVPQSINNGDPRVFASEQGLQNYLDFYGFIHGATARWGTICYAHDQDAGVWYYMEREVQ